MKKLLLIIALFIIVAKSTPVLAGNDCLNGKVNDPFPGSCGQYLDNNKDNICDHSQTAPQASSTPATKNYHFFFIATFLIISYGLTYLLSLGKIITLFTHRKIWNFFLLFSFFVSGILGILLVLKVSYNWPLPFPNSLFWHVEAGIAMATVAFFHILWHLNYFLPKKTTGVTLRREKKANSSEK